MKRFSISGVRALVATGAIVLGLAPVPAASSGVSSLWDNCTQVHTKYAHGVGKAGARDRTRSGSNPVTTFKRSTRLYNVAMRSNSDLDRDRDGIACEKH